MGLVIPFLLLWPKAEGLPLQTFKLWWAFGLFLVGAWTDFWDGWVARRHHLETDFGRILDPTADKIFILGAMASFAARGVYSFWYLVPIFLREVAVTFSRVVWLHQGQAIGAERAGKIKLASQLVSVLFSFIFLLRPGPATFYLNQLFLILALLMSLYSGFFFFRHHQDRLKDKRFLQTVAALGVGRLKPFPGTYGSLLGLAWVPLIAFDPGLHLTIFLFFLWIAYLVIQKMNLAEGEDPLEIVIDEFLGILLSFWMVPINWKTLALGFFLFRFFDVSKILGLRWLEKKKGAHGIILDDLGAGAYTWIVLKILGPKF